jgi:hypothetical protein
VETKTRIFTPIDWRLRPDWSACTKSTQAAHVPPRIFPFMPKMHLACGWLYICPHPHFKTLDYLMLY